MITSQALPFPLDLPAETPGRIQEGLRATDRAWDFEKAELLQKGRTQAYARVKAMLNWVKEGGQRPSTWTWLEKAASADKIWTPSRVTVDDIFFFFFFFF